VGSTSRRPNPNPGNPGRVKKHLSRWGASGPLFQQSISAQRGGDCGYRKSLMPKNLKSKDLPLPAVLLAGLRPQCFSEQLIWLDFHQLDWTLAGRSDVPLQLTEGNPLSSISIQTCFRLNSLKCKSSEIYGFPSAQTQAFSQILHVLSFPLTNPIICV